MAALLADREGKRAALKILARRRRTVWGSRWLTSPYAARCHPTNALLGGKLIAMLAVGPEMVEAYRERYQEAESEIASSMAARPIIRPAQLVLLGTTSLYGVCSSQYNRVRVPAERLGGRPGDEIRYRELGRSRGLRYLTVQLSHRGGAGETRAPLEWGAARKQHLWRGRQPKLRKVRDGLDALQFPTEHLLRHGRRRIVYGVTLVQNTREFLLGMEDRPGYLFSFSGAKATAAISEWWRERWLSHRIERDPVLEEVEAHTLVRPVRHGARVKLPADSAGLESFPRRTGVTVGARGNVLAVERSWQVRCHRSAARKELLSTDTLPPTP